jgi:8-amino-7-oxononanoate synthase
MSQLSWEHEISRRLQQWSDEGLRRELRLADGKGVRLTVAGKSVVSFASNDYLGLSGHPKLAEAARTAIQNSGTGSSASPLLAGYKSEHERLEKSLSAFKQSEAALVFSSGFAAALATITALAGPDDLVVADRLAHASLIDATKLSRARMRVFKHNDVDDLKRILAKEHGRHCLIVVESLYSMDGDTAPLNELVELSAEAGALLLVDEAHATGTLGPSGRGALEAITCAAGDLPRHLIAMGTLSKALASQGGFICARREIIDAIVHSGRAYLFSTALAPASAAAANAALTLIDDEPQRRTKLDSLCHLVRTELDSRKIEMLSGTGPIIPVMAGDERRATQLSAALLERGLLAPAIRYPTVKRSQARLRISLSAAHEREDCVRLLTALAAILK